MKILDCTLRDDGFVNGWHFGASTITNIYHAQDHAGIDIIEIEYIKNKTDYNPDVSLFPNTESVS
jgi:4-hydroxy 2-oxovalerate aldolase